MRSVVWVISTLTRLTPMRKMLVRRRMISCVAYHYVAGNLWCAAVLTLAWSELLKNRWEQNPRRFRNAPDR